MAKKSEWITVEADVEAVQDALSKTSKSLTSIQRQVIGVLARETVKTIKGAIRSTTIRHTGELLRCYGYRIKKDGSTGSVYPRGTAGSKIFPKVYTLNYGTPARPKQDAKGFIQSGENYLQKDHTGEMEKIVEKTLQKAGW